MIQTDRARSHSFSQQSLRDRVCVYIPCHQCNSQSIFTDWSPPWYEGVDGCLCYGTSVVTTNSRGRHTHIHAHEAPRFSVTMWDRQRINNVEPLTIAGIKLLTLSRFSVNYFLPRNFYPTFHHLLTPIPSTIPWLDTFKCDKIMMPLRGQSRYCMFQPCLFSRVYSKCGLLWAVGCRRVDKTPPCWIWHKRANTHTGQMSRPTKEMHLVVAQQPSVAMTDESGGGHWSVFTHRTEPGACWVWKLPQ